MTTYVEMQTRIADELLDSGALSTAQIKLAILSAVNHYQRRSFYFNSKKASALSTVASQEYYTSSDLSDIPNIVQIDGATVTVSGYKRPVKSVDFETIDDEQDGFVTGPPRYVAIYNQKLRLFPMPDAVYTVTLAYIYKLTALSADADTNAWMEEFNGEELIRQSAKRILAMDILHADDIAARCGAREIEVRDELLLETQRRWKSELKYPAMPLKPQSFNITTGA